MHHLQSFLEQCELDMVLHALITSGLDYCCALHGAAFEDGPETSVCPKCDNQATFWEGIHGSCHSGAERSAVASYLFLGIIQNADTYLQGLDGLGQDPRTAFSHIAQPKVCLTRPDLNACFKR